MLRRLVLKGPIAKTAKAGQFVAVQVQDSSISSFDPFLRRPISLAEISPDQDEITLLYRIQGRGTEILARARCGERLSVMGPLGKGFSLPEVGELWLVAGGIGIFPLYALAQSALAQGLIVRLFWGGENQSFLKSAGLPAWQTLGIPIHLCTIISVVWARETGGPFKPWADLCSHLWPKKDDAGSDGTLHELCSPCAGFSGRTHGLRSGSLFRVCMCPHR